MVIKRDNRREPFLRDKMRVGIVRACQKRPIEPAAIERLVSEVEYSLQDFVLEVPSTEIGERILKCLYDLDTVAYVRFASVYRSFGDVYTFLLELQKLKETCRPRPVEVHRPMAPTEKPFRPTFSRHPLGAGTL